MNKRRFKIWTPSTFVVVEAERSFTDHIGRLDLYNRSVSPSVTVASFAPGQWTHFTSEELT
jgi:hypothetical protein